MNMTIAEIEKRLTAIERELAELRQRAVIPRESPNHWIEKIAGTYSTPEEVAAFKKAAEYGRKWRNSFRPKSRKRKASKK
jgi:hypothetical protein